MTLPASPPITLAQVRVEFGAPTGTPLHAFNRGGAWVPNTAANSGVPTAAPIRLAQLCGASAYTSITGVTATPSSAFKTDNLLEPAPSSKTVTSGAVAIAWSGGNPGATVSWARLSGDATMTQTGTTSSTWSALVAKNTNKSASYRATVSDGISSGTVDVPVSLEYTSA